MRKCITAKSLCQALRKKVLLVTLSNTRRDNPVERFYGLSDQVSWDTFLWSGRGRRGVALKGTFSIFVLVRRAVFYGCAWLFLLHTATVFAEDWSPLLVVRFGNIDAIDAEDGELAGFVRNIRNDGRFPPPMRTLVGPRIRNSTFFGVVFEGWVERVTLASIVPGATKTVWAVPVDNREEYLTFMAGQGMSEYEGMDGVIVLREMEADGAVKNWYLQWLPGNVGVFGDDREAVMAARRIYADNSAARGLLFGTGGRFVNPDIMIRVNMPAVASWQDRETGRYWWRERLEEFAEDLRGYWKPDGARRRLLGNLTEAAIMWPRRVERLDACVWFEPDGVEWSLELEGEYGFSGSSLLPRLRVVPDRSALAWAAPVTPSSLSELVGWVGEVLLSAAGGVVTGEARDAGRGIAALVENGGIREVVSALVPPPVGKPELGGVRLVVTEWQFPEQADRVWERIKVLLGSDRSVSVALSQMGVQVRIEEDELFPGTLGVTVYPSRGAVGGEYAQPYYRATWTWRRNGSLVVLVTGLDREDRAERRRIRDYRSGLAGEVAGFEGEGGGDVRETFVRMGSEGASWLGFFEPVRFLQFCLIEAADWRPRSPDQLEPRSTQLAREMLEYGAGRAWTAAGVSRLNHWRLDGVASWESLTRLAAALGVTETIGM